MKGILNLLSFRCRRFPRQPLPLAVCLFVASSSFAGPRIYCAEPSWDFGERFNGGKLVREFQIENRGDEPLQFGKLKSCCGLTIDFPYASLAPGSNAVCKVTFDVTRRRGKQAKEIYISSNDRKKPYLILKMQGILREALEVEPRFIRYSPADSVGSKTVKLTSASKSPFAVTDINCKVKGIQVSKKKLSDLEWELDVSLAPDFAGGKVRGAIEVETDHPDHPKLNVSLYGQVAAGLKVSPSEVVLQSGPDPVTRYVAVRAEEPFKILSFKLADATGEVDQKALGKNGYRFSLQLNPSEVKHGARLCLTTDHPRMPEITIPFHLVD